MIFLNASFLRPLFNSSCGRECQGTGYRCILGRFSNCRGDMYDGWKGCVDYMESLFRNSLLKRQHHLAIIVNRLLFTRPQQRKLKLDTNQNTNTFSGNERPLIPFDNTAYHHGQSFQASFPRIMQNIHTQRGKVAFFSNIFAPNCHKLFQKMT